MSAVLQLMVFAGAAAVAIATIVITIGAQWRRIARLATGEVDQPGADRWHRVHLEADRRQPFDQGQAR